MTRRASSGDPLRAWAALPLALRRAIAGLQARQLDRRDRDDELTIREYVHHIVESNLVASNIVLAALGSPGCRYDWSWVLPNGAWMKRLGYDELPIGTSLALLEALVLHLTAVLRRSPAALRRTVRLLDRPGAALRRRMVAQVLADECEHARHHLQEVSAAKARLRDPASRPRRR